MAMQEPQEQRRPNPRRRQRSKMQDIKEVYLPTVILGLTVIFILIFIIGGAIRRNSDPGTNSTAGTESTAATQDPNQAALLAQEARDLLAGAALLAQDYDYTGAMALLESFSGELAEHAELSAAYNSYKAADDALVGWTASQVPNLSFHLLIADPERAFTDKELGSSYTRNFITTDEFIAILNQLYSNGYMLVSLDQLYTTDYNSSTGRDVYKENVIRLPEGKKPIMLTQVNVSYYTYMIDSDGDGLADAKGDGFASKLCYGDQGFYNEMVQADGTTTYGNYDMVPILESFIQEHAGFSYRGARATVAFTGSDGILGYRVNSSRLTAQERQQEAEKAKAVADALREHGYDLACYTYNNIDYNTNSATQIQSDQQKWAETVTSVIGQLDILVFARDSDIGTAEAYSGSKFTLLYNSGYRFFMGVSETPWNQVSDLYVRHNRLMVTGDNLKNRPDLYAGLFDAATVMDIYRTAG